MVGRRCQTTTPSIPFSDYRYIMDIMGFINKFLPLNLFSHSPLRNGKNPLSTTVFSPAIFSAHFTHLYQFLFQKILVQTGAGPRPDSSCFYQVWVIIIIMSRRAKVIGISKIGLRVKESSY